jgi:hypothetical protein
MALREIESTLPPGFRFFPSDEELVCHYLHKKVANERIAQGSTLVEVDLHAREPWELPGVCLCSIVLYRLSSNTCLTSSISFHQLVNYEMMPDMITATYISATLSLSLSLSLSLYIYIYIYCE